MFNQAQHISASRGDIFLKDVLNDPFRLEWTGNVEAPTGYVLRTHITSQHIAEFAQKEGLPWLTERRNFTPGWYLIQQDDRGFVYGNYYGDGNDGERTSSEDYAEIETEYAKWDPEPDPEPINRPDHVILVAFQISGAKDREQAELIARHMMPTPGRSHSGIHLECWWVAEDDRKDGSDNDSAVFVRPGNQKVASRMLFYSGLTDRCNVIPNSRQNPW